MAKRKVKELTPVELDLLPTVTWGTRILYVEPDDKPEYEDAKGVTWLLGRVNDFVVRMRRPF